MFQARVHLSRLFPARLGRAVGRARARAAGVLREVPVLFFVVVLGVALTFRAAIGWARSTPDEEPAAPAPAAAAASAPLRLAADPQAVALPSHPEAAPAASAFASPLPARRPPPRRRAPRRGPRRRPIHR